MVYTYTTLIVISSTKVLERIESLVTRNIYLCQKETDLMLLLYGSHLSIIIGVAAALGFHR